MGFPVISHAQKDVQHEYSTVIHFTRIRKKRGRVVRLNPPSDSFSGTLWKPRKQIGDHPPLPSCPMLGCPAEPPAIFFVNFCLPHVLLPETRYEDRGIQMQGGVSHRSMTFCPRRNRKGWFRRVGVPSRSHDDFRAGEPCLENEDRPYESDARTHRSGSPDLSSFLLLPSLFFSRSRFPALPLDNTAPTRSGVRPIRPCGLVPHSLRHAERRPRPATGRFRPASVIHSP